MSSDPFAIAESAIVPSLNLADMSDGDLAALAGEIAEEQYRRAVEGADPAALVELGYAEMFDSRGMPHDPRLVSGLLVCAGTKIERSRASHDCSWANVDDVWVWEYEDRLAHELRHLPASGGLTVTRAVSVLVPFEGLELDQVVGKQRTGSHNATSVRSWTVTGGELVLRSARAIAPAARH